MQVSAWLYLAQQSLLTLCLLLSLHRAIRLPCPAPLRLHSVSLLLGAGCLLAAMDGSVWIQALLTALTLLAPFGVWPGIPRRLRLRVMLVFAALSLLLTGWLRMLAGFGLPPQLVLFLGCMLSLLLPAMPTQCTTACVAVRMMLGEQSITLTALVDSGNLLRDRVSGLPVIVVDRATIRQLFVSAQASTTPPSTRAMPVRTVTGTALMTIFRPDTLMLEIEGRWHTAQAMIGLSPEAHMGIAALIPAALLTKLKPSMTDKEDLPCL